MYTFIENWHRPLYFRGRYGFIVMLIPHNNIQIHVLKGHLINTFQADPDIFTVTLEKRLPRAIIIGTMKSGTAALIHFLVGVSGGVVTAPEGEPDFFSKDVYFQGLQAYKEKARSSLKSLQ